MGLIERSYHDVYPFISAEHNLKGAAQGKSLLITGAAGGIGRAIALHFAAAGATSIIAAGRTLATLSETKTIVEKEHPHCSVHPLTVDVTEAASVDSFFAKLPFLPDILINNAGICHSQVHVADSDPELWWQDMAVNVKGVYLGTRAYLRALKGGAGTIITVSSSQADMADPNMTSYSGAKIAVNRFTEIVQKEYEAQGVKAYAFHPGGIASTGMGSTAPEQYARWLCDTVDMAAGMALYLSTPRAEYLKGRFVYGAWDMEKVEALKDEIVQDNLLIHKLDVGSKMGTSIILDSGERA